MHILSWHASHSTRREVVSSHFGRRARLRPEAGVVGEAGTGEAGACPGILWAFRRGVPLCFMGSQTRASDAQDAFGFGPSWIEAHRKCHLRGLTFELSCPRRRAL